MKIIEYIQSDKRGKEANRIEREALYDSFLQEALEGFSSIPGDHAKVIAQFEKRFANISRSQDAVSARKAKQFRFLYGSVAASLLILLGFGVYFLTEKNDRHKANLAMVQSKKDEIKEDAFSFEQQTAERESKQLMMDDDDANVSKSTLYTEADANTSKVALHTEADTNASKYARQTAIKESDLWEKELHDVIEMEKNNIEAETVSFSSDEEESTVLIKQESVQAALVLKPLETSSDSASEKIVARSAERSEKNGTFGEKEFQAWCQKTAAKNLCDGKTVSIKFTFFINVEGKPIQIEYNRFTCEKAKEEMARLLSETPAWTKINRKVTMTVRW